MTIPETTPGDSTADLVCAEGPIFTAMTMAKQQAAFIMDRISDLEQRLAPILSIVPSAAEEPKADAPAASPFHGAIAEHGEVLLTARIRLECILERIQL